MDLFGQARQSVEATKEMLFFMLLEKNETKNYSGKTEYQ